jgi:hypothetical protein
MLVTHTAYLRDAAYLSFPGVVAYAVVKDLLDHLLLGQAAGQARPHEVHTALVGEAIPYTIACHDHEFVICLELRNRYVRLPGDDLVRTRDPGHLLVLEIS